MTSRPPRTLRSGLIATYVAVISAALAAGFIAVRTLTPRLADRGIQTRLGSGRGSGPGSGPQADADAALSSDFADAYSEALTVAMVVAFVVGLVVAVALAYWFTRRLLNRVGELQDATRRLADGDYGHHVAEPQEAELAHLAASINTLGRQLSDTEESRARLVSDLAHELRNPLATIEGYMEGLIDGVLPATAETFATVATEAQRLSRLTDDLSLLSGAQEGALQFDFQSADLGEIAAAVADRLQPQFTAKGVELAVDLQDALPVRVDLGRINQALTNVVGNALVHAPAGGRVLVRGERSAGDCRVNVIDDGDGIPTAQLEAIFNRFTRLDSEGGGTGIGLSIARTLARSHNGDLTAHSDGVGAGATFTLTLPAA